MTEWASDYVPYLLVLAAVIAAGVLFFLARRKGNC
jgi:hypothetical protein